LRINLEMRRDGNARRAPLLLGILLGLLALAAGALAAGVFLPEWRAEPREPEVYRERYRELVTQAGFRLAPGEPRVRLVTREREVFEPYRQPAAEGLTLAKRGVVRIEVVHEAQRPDSREAGSAVIDFSPEGLPLLFNGWDRRFWSVFQPRNPDAEVRVLEKIASQMLAPGESMAPSVKADYGPYPRRIYPLVGGPVPEYLITLASGNFMVIRMEGSVEPGLAALDEAMSRLLSRSVGRLLLLGAAFVLFLILLLRSRISISNGALLALLCLVTLNATQPAALGAWRMGLVVAVFHVAWIFFLWCSAESLLRTVETDFTTSLDALRTGRLGPRGGSGLLLGWAFGAGLAGLRLGLFALSAAVPGSWPDDASVALPVFRFYGSPVAAGVELAAIVALAFALALRVLPLRWAPVAAAAGTGFLATSLPLHPLPAELAANLLFASLLVHVCRRHGLTTLLTASVVSFLLPAVLFSGLHLDWMPVTFALTAGMAVGIVALGFIGLSRSAAAEVERLHVPGFVRQIEEARRLKHEMGLLARMQQGLLPREIPRVPGWEIAARSVLANEAGGDLYDFLWDEEGRLWIAAGDVAGHGYSCAVAQAMTKAALASLVNREKSPAALLGRADRVLRNLGTARNFTSLALLRLDPGTGEARLSNASHPFPLLAAGGEVSEIDLPSLPLGLGPRRTYEDRPLDLPPGAALVFFSDGLCEAMDWNGSVYGYERVREVLHTAAERPAEKILEALFADWRRHLRGAPPADDTTVVVLKRSEGGI
jgi:hypothetical protein